MDPALIHYNQRHSRYLSEAGLLDGLLADTLRFGRSVCDRDTRARILT